MLLQDAVARRYAFKGPFDSDLLTAMEDPIRREIFGRLLLTKTTPEMIFELLVEKYPEMLKNLFNVHGTVLAKVGGAKNLHRIFQETPKAEKRKDGIRKVYRLPGGQIMGVTD